MPNTKLHEALDALHRELSQSPTLDESTLASMQSIVDEIRVKIASSATSLSQEMPPPKNLNDRLQNMISDFEVRHPQFTALLSQVADRLNDLGI